MQNCTLAVSSIWLLFCILPLNEYFTQWIFISFIVGRQFSPALFLLTVFAVSVLPPLGRSPGDQEGSGVGSTTSKRSTFICLDENSCRYTLKKHVQSLYLKHPHSFILPCFNRQFLSPFVESLWKSLKTIFVFRCFGLNPLLSFSFESSCSLFSHRTSQLFHFILRLRYWTRWSSFVLCFSGSKREKCPCCGI